MAFINSLFNSNLLNMQSKSKSITLIATRAITINLFLKDIVNKLSKKYDITLICKDPENLFLKNLKKKKN